jgi:hypothetical protein
VGQLGEQHQQGAAAGRIPDSRHRADHPIRRMLFEFKDLPQIPSINFWNQSGRRDLERDELSAEPHFAASPTSRAVSWS